MGVLCIYNGLSAYILLKTYIPHVYRSMYVCQSIHLRSYVHVYLHFSVVSQIQ